MKGRSYLMAAAVAGLAAVYSLAAWAAPFARDGLVVTHASRHYHTAPETIAAVSGIWEQRPAGVLIQVGLACLGLLLIVGAALPVPGTRTRPSTYFIRSYGDPLGDFFARFAGTASLILAMIFLAMIAAIQNFGNETISMWTNVAGKMDQASNQ